MTVNIFRGKNVEKQNWTHNGCEQMLSALRRKKNEIGRMGTYLSHTDRPTDRQIDIHNYKEKYAVCLFNSCQANYVSYLFHHFSPFSKS
jgi:hypothetical protein